MKDSKCKIISGILVLIIIFLIAALVYFVLQNNKLEKEITSNTTSVSSDNSSSNQENSVTINQPLVIRDIDSFIYDNGLCNDSKSNTIDADNNYYKLNFKYLGIKKEDDEEKCSIIVDDKFEFLIGKTVYSSTNFNSIIKTDKYYILEYESTGGLARFNFDIYDINGNFKYSEENYSTYVFGDPYVKNNIYYYNSYVEIDDQHDRLYHKSIDLNKNTIISKGDDIGYIIDKLPQSS